MLVKGYRFSLPIFYWFLYIPIFLLTSYKALFFDWQIQNFYFNELEDFGRYVMILSNEFYRSVYISIDYPTNCVFMSKIS